jgi:hypothetical protein
MRRHALALLAASLLGASLLAAPAARAQTIATETGRVHTTNSLSTAATYGSAMGGMLVTAHFADGAALSAAWGDLGEGVFGVSTARFRLALPGDANSGSPGEYLWTLDNLWAGGLTRLVLSGAPGATVFDINGEEELTPNSAYGIPLAFAPHWAEDELRESPYAAGARVTYRNAVALVGSSPLGDLFEQMDLEFGLALAGGDGVTFDLDTDSLGAGDSLDPVDPTVTPEPASVALVGGGLAAVGLVGARRRAARG